MSIHRKIKISERDFSKEFIFSTSRSGGAGGQHVNKVETKVELRFNITDSKILSDEEKQTILTKLKNQINSKNELVLTSQTERSQMRNKQQVINKFYTLIKWALQKDKKRIPTKPSKAAVRRRLETKQKHSEKKALRRNKFE